MKPTSRRVLTRLGLLAASVATLSVFVEAAIWDPETAGAVNVGRVETLLAETDVALAGLVTDAEGRTIPGASVTLALFSGTGETIWRIIRPVDHDGVFGFRSRDLPDLANVYPGTIAVSAPDHVSARAPVTVRIDKPTGNAPAIAAITPRRVQLHPEALNPWLTLIVLLPAIFGLVAAVVHLAQYSKGRHITYWFAFGAATLWSAVAAELAVVNVLHGYTVIPLFWPDFLVSAGVVQFAFIGTVIYVAYSVLQRGPGFYFDATEDEKRFIILTLGGRVLMAPYIALVAWAIFAGTFPTLRTGGAAAFFAFFTGLWIKPVMEALNDIGMRFLSADQQQKIADRLARTSAPEAPPAQTTSVAVLKPEQALLDAVAEARKELLPKEGVIGIDAGLKVASSDVASARPSIVVYVYEKQPPAAVVDLVPPMYRGFPTDVVELPTDVPTKCRTLFSKLSWDKIDLDTPLPGNVAPAPSAHRVQGTDVALVVDPNVTLLNTKAKGQSIFNVLRCYKTVESLLGDRHDFIAFVIDNASGLMPGNLPIGDYHVPVFSDISGTNYNAPGNPGSFAETAAWGATRLRACSVLSLFPERSPRRYLHELGHYWTAYASIRVKGPTSQLILQDSSDPDQGKYHWGLNFDDGRSCMDYDQTQWTSTGGNLFSTTIVTDDQFEYCPLDLYLMGLIPATEVGPLRVVTNRIDVGPTLFKADLKTFTIDDVIAACGPRIPEAGRAPTNFRQAIVVVSRDQVSGEAYAHRINDWLPMYRQAFSRATGQRASLDTTLQP